MSLIHPRSTCYCRQCITPRRGAKENYVSLSSPVIVPAKTIPTHPRESTIARRPSPSSTPSVASTLGMKRLPRTRKSLSLAKSKSHPVRHACHLLREYNNPSISHSLASRAIIRRTYTTLSTSFDPRSSLTSSCPPPRQVANRMSVEEGKEPLLSSSSRTRSPQLSSAHSQTHRRTILRLVVHRRLHWRRAWQKPKQPLRAHCLTPCNPRLARAPPYAAIRARPAGASAASGETYIFSAEHHREKEREGRAMLGLRDAMRGGGAARDPTRSKQLCRRGGRAATERDDADCCYCWSLLVLLLLLLLALLPLALASVAEATLLVGGGSIKAREKSWMEEGLGKKREMCGYLGERSSLARCVPAASFDPPKQPLF